jgi:hypothetical protein
MIGVDFGICLYLKDSTRSEQEQATASVAVEQAAQYSISLLFSACDSFVGTLGKRCRLSSGLGRVQMRVASIMGGS